jgi:serine/threonine protein kinase
VWTTHLHCRELFMGQRPWAGLSHGQIIHAITSGKTLSLSSSCPADLKKFILKCMAPSPEARPTFSQILKDLETLEEDLVGL